MAELPQNRARSFPPRRPLIEQAVRLILNHAKAPLLTCRGSSMDINALIDTFLSAPTYAVVGASRDRNKYGNKVLRCYQQNARNVFPVNPGVSDVEGLTAYPSLMNLPDPVESVSIITPPHVTETIVDDAHQAGVKNLWMQPGAESPTAVERAEELGLNVIADGSCLLVVLGFKGP